MVQFRQRWENLPDARMSNNNMKYAMVDGVLAASAVFFMQSSSFLAHQRLLQSRKGRNNARSLRINPALFGLSVFVRCAIFFNRFKRFHFPYFAIKCKKRNHGR